MKITPEHYNHLRGLVMPHMQAHPDSEYQLAGLSSKRWRWDCLYAARAHDFICQDLYGYLDDDHIDTALRHIAKELS